jgi:alkaline phosphatase D
VQRLLRSTSVAAIWDDHDVRNNFGGRDGPRAPLGLRAFLEYWPVAAPASEPDRLYRSLRWGRLLDLFIVDTRSYRSANWRPDGPGKTMLGARQRRWLVDAVAASTATWKVIVSSVPLSIEKAWPFCDSWARCTLLGYPTGFATERDAILSELRARDVRRLVVLAGDVHFGALMTHRPLPALDVHELIAGPLAASTKAPTPPTGDLGSVVHVARGGTPTFGELVADTDRLTARLFDGHGRLLGEVVLR